MAYNVKVYRDIYFVYFQVRLIYILDSLYVIYSSQHNGIGAAQKGYVFALNKIVKVILVVDGAFKIVHVLR